MTDKAKERKDTPVFSGVMKYFPDAIKAVARVSKAGNDQHHPGKPLHWDKSKSTDQEDALMRHLMDHFKDPVDDDGQLHLAKVAWRALAALQTFLEKDEDLEHSKFPNKDGLHPREAREERVRRYRLSQDRMNIVGQNGNTGEHYEETQKEIK